MAMEAVTDATFSSEAPETLRRLWKKPTWLFTFNPAAEGRMADQVRSACDQISLHDKVLF